MLRKARIGDVKAIHKMINFSADRGEMLPRSLMDIYGNLRDFFVYYKEDGETVVGVCAMSIIWENLAEIRSLYVCEGHRGQGVARHLIKACLSEAASLDLLRVFTLTSQLGLFAHLGFHEVGRSSLSEKIWLDCFRCSKYPDYCDETAMIIEL